MFFSNVSPYSLSYNEDGTQRTIKSQALPNGAGLPGLMFVDPAGAEPNLPGNPTLNYQVTGTVRRHIPLYPLGKFTAEPNGTMYVYKTEVIVALNNQWWTANTITVRARTQGGDNTGTNTISIKYGTQTEFMFLSTTDQWKVFHHEPGQQMKISSTNATTGGSGNTTTAVLVAGQLLQIIASHATVQSGSLDNVCVRYDKGAAVDYGVIRILVPGREGSGVQLIVADPPSNDQLLGNFMSASNYVNSRIKLFSESPLTLPENLTVYTWIGSVFVVNMPIGAYTDLPSNTIKWGPLPGYNVSTTDFPVTGGIGVTVPAGVYKIEFSGMTHSPEVQQYVVGANHITRGRVLEYLNYTVTGPYEDVCTLTQAIDNRSTAYNVTINVTFLN